MKEPLVSIIMPAYNAGPFIAEAIYSVLQQHHKNWELLIVNDGSKDQTEQQVLQFQDPRIRYFSQSNQGVSAARNKALSEMRGDYFCFLDADDIYPTESISSRINMMELDTTLDFVDGVVVFKTEDLATEIRRHIPSFRGQPYEQLLRINTACLFGNSWMIRRRKDFKYQFSTELKYAEDLFFYLTISKDGGNFSFTENEILWYRRHASSAMANTSGLEKGYRDLYRLVKHQLHANSKQLAYLKYKISRIMFATWLKGERKPITAFRSLFDNIRL